MNTEPSETELVDWLAALLRAFHPFSWLLSLAGVILTGVILMMAQALIAPDPPTLSDWVAQPVERAQALAELILDQSLGGTILRGGLLLALLVSLWCLVGGGIARAELIARRRGRADLPEDSAQPGATAFLLRWAKPLLKCGWIVLCLGLLILVPVLVAGAVNQWLGGMG